MNTKWYGLFAQERAAFYSGNVIAKKDIPKYTRIVMRYNKYYSKGSGRPKFVYCFADSEGYEDKCVPIEYEDSLKSKVDELTGVLKEAHHCPMMLASESVDRANDLMRRAIKIIEEMTGEEWRFEYLTY